MQMFRTPRASRPVAGARRTLSRSVRAVVAHAKATAKELQEEFGIDGHVKFMEGSEGLVKAVMKHSCGCSAEVHLLGGCITSWTQAAGSEVLYLRPDAKFDGSKPISGGIPHCFPQFGPGEMQQHGFARNVEWEVGSTSADLQPDERDPCLELVLRPSEYSDKMFPYKFKVVYSITLHETQLQTDYRVINEDDKPFDFTAALHSYFEIQSVKEANVRGLKGLTYLDKSENAEAPEKKVEDREKVPFGDGLVDSVYLDSPGTVELDVATGAAVSISATGWSDCVVWNPHLTMKECYKEFVCVENAQFGKAVTVKPGENWRATTVMDVIDL